MYRSIRTQLTTVRGMELYILAASHWSASIALSPRSFTTPIFPSKGPKSRLLCSSCSTSLKAFLYTSCKRYSVARLCLIVRKSSTRTGYNSRNEGFPIHEIFRYILDSIGEVETILVTINTFVTSFSELDIITRIAESQLPIILWQLIKAFSIASQYHIGLSNSLSTDRSSSALGIVPMNMPPVRRNFETFSIIIRALEALSKA